ncbi:PAPS_reduct domain-containing protein [Vibrio chagasii]|nr:PAPS_reduct domain-containing protein [Vibrio chagasii]
MMITPEIMAESNIELIKFMADNPLVNSPSFFSCTLNADYNHMDSTVVLSVSGGQTSMMMAALIKSTLPYHNVVCIFANTGLENEETLQFVDQCDKAFNLNVQWIEAVTNPIHGKGVTHRATNFNDAFRCHQYKEHDHPFHAHVRKNGVPNMARPQCSDRLKEFAIEHYKKVNGLKGYPHSLGMRDDEPLRAMPKPIRNILDNIDVTPKQFRVMSHQHRLNTYTGSCHGYWKLEDEHDFSEYEKIERYSNKLKKYNLVYLLADAWQLDKQDVELFWEAQPFRLQLKEHQGNCQTCWKKSDKKLLLLAIETPTQFEAFGWYEKTYSHVKPLKNGDARFFRRQRTAGMILGEAKLMDLYALRKSVIGSKDATDSDGCGSSCESYALGDLEAA